MSSIFAVAISSSSLFGVETAVTLASGDPGEIVLVGMLANQVTHQDILFVQRAVLGKL